VGEDIVQAISNNRLLAMSAHPSAGLEKVPSVRNKRQALVKPTYNGGAYMVNIGNSVGSLWQ